MDKPNILLITSDQHRGDALGVNGHPCVQTPHLDGLAFAGANFANAYSTCPICMPARTSIITGQDAARFGCPGNRPGFCIDYPRERMLGSCLRDAGYQTELVGKTHFLADPSDRVGFDHITSDYHLKKRLLMEHGQTNDGNGMGANEVSTSTERLPEELNETHWCTEACLDFLETRDQTQPFFLWASYTAPHPPITAIEPYYSMYDNDAIPEPIIPDWMDDERAPLLEYDIRYRTNPLPMREAELRKVRSVYYGKITYMDHQIGRILGRLVEKDLLDNTLIIYTSDHGEKLGDFGSFWKATHLEPSCRVPLLVKWPKDMDFAPGQTPDALVCLQDLLPTCVDFAGGVVPDDISGQSLAPLLDGTPGRDALWGNYNNAAYMLRTRTHKYLYYCADGAELVFDMHNDPSEERDLSGDRALTESLRNQLLELLRERGDPNLRDGALPNHGRTKPSKANLRANHLKWQGLRRAGRRTG